MIWGSGRRGFGTNQDWGSGRRGFGTNQDWGSGRRGFGTNQDFIPFFMFVYIYDGDKKQFLHLSYLN